MDATKTITAIEVHEIFVDCLFREDEPIVDPAIGEGILQRYGFHPGRIANHSQRIHELLLALPEGFREDKGGGWTFLNACDDAAGNHWGEHRNMDELFVLGLATGKCRSVLPRDMWDALPGGMPYYAVVAPMAGVQDSTVAAK